MPFSPEFAEPTACRRIVKLRRQLVNGGFADRIVFGSDGTENGVDLLQDGIDAVRAASSISDAQRRAIPYTNAGVRRTLRASTSCRLPL
jgi:predicted TIM-barrel fold metal-dependent hydrolase